MQVNVKSVFETSDTRKKEENKKQRTFNSSLNPHDTKLLSRSASTIHSLSGQTNHRKNK